MKKWMRNLSPTSLAPREEMSFSQKYDLKQILFLGLSPFIGIITIWYHVSVEGFDSRLLILSLILAYLGIMCTAAGYHRYYSHKSFKASAPLQLFFLLFGPSALQNSAIKWANDHRRHHKFSEKKEDPYPIYKGFLYAHILWPMDAEKKRYRTNMVKDLLKEPLTVWQHINYKWLAILHTVILPIGIGWYFFDSPIGGVAFLGLLKVFLIQQSSACINSLGHFLGTRKYDPISSATDSFINGILTFGEGYHNFHHKFPNDYRHGHKIFDWDPTKWFLQLMGILGLAKDFKTTKQVHIDRAVDAKFLL